jgi:NhaC family Na+:H+ antiporter
VALVPVAFLVLALWLCLVHFSELGLTTHVPLVLATGVAAVLGKLLGHRWAELEAGMVQGIGLALKAVLILLVIGLLVSAWIQAGIVPAMVAYGLELLSPDLFLVASVAICALVSLATGSSWSTVATVGIALMGVGGGLGLPAPMVAGAVISGAYFGDKMSPLSDTTNLAPAVAGADLFDHVRHMLWTTGPSLGITLGVFALIGWGRSAGHEPADAQALAAAIRAPFVIHPALLLPPLLVVAMVVLRVPALPALLGGALLGALLAIGVQGVSPGEVLRAAHAGVKSATGNPLVDDLLSRGGLESMLPTVALIIVALSFGGVLERTRMLEVISGAVLRLARGTGGLVAATVVSCLGMNVLASDQYLAIVVPGRMYREAYRARGLHPKNLSRALEDSGTLTSPLIPWNTCGAFMIATLGIAPWTYVPYCVLNLVNPVISMLYGITGWTMTRRSDEDGKDSKDSKDDN